MARVPNLLLAVMWPVVLLLVLPWAIAARWCEPAGRTARRTRRR